MTAYGSGNGAYVRAADMFAGLNTSCTAGDPEPSSILRGFPSRVEIYFP